MERTDVKYQFKDERDKAVETAPRTVGSGKNPPNTLFGERYDDLPKDPAELDAVIEDLTEDLSGSVQNPQVVQKYQKVCCFVVLVLWRWWFWCCRLWWWWWRGFCVVNG